VSRDGIEKLLIEEIENPQKTDFTLAVDGRRFPTLSRSSRTEPGQWATIPTVVGVVARSVGEIGEGRPTGI